MSLDLMVAAVVTHGALLLILPFLSNIFGIFDAEMNRNIFLLHLFVSPFSIREIVPVVQKHFISVSPQFCGSEVLDANV